MTILKAALIMLVSSLLGAAGGAIMGYSIGKFAPSYYETVYSRRSSHRPPLPVEEQPPRGERPWRGGYGPDQFYPEEVGFGLGITQGFGIGVGVGCLILVCVTWANWRRDVPVVAEE